MKNKYCVFSTGTDNYIPHAVVSLKTFKKHNMNYDVFVLCTNLSKENKLLCEYCEVTAVEINLSGIFYKEWRYPKECYYHFKAPDLFLSMGYEYSVYIDGDTYCNSKFFFDRSKAFHIAGFGYDTNKEFFTEIGEYEKIKHHLEITDSHGFNKRRIQSGVIVYNNKKLKEIDFFKKVGNLYDRSIKKRIPRKGDDSLLSLMITVHPEIITEQLSRYHNLIDYKTMEEDFLDDDIFANCVMYHCVAQKPWFSLSHYFNYPHKFFVHKWLEMMINSFTQEDIKRCYPEKYKENLLEADEVDFFWFSIPPPNFGDWVTPYLVKKICDRQVNNSVDPSKTKKNVIISTGSIMRLCGPNTIVWGSGIRDRHQDIKPGKLIRSTRGPLTRQRVLEVGGECPPIYGDPALLLPRVYSPIGVNKKYILGIIPHISQYNRVQELYKNEKGLVVIDLRTKDIESVLNKIFQCEKIVSSSLHGIIVSNAYSIPVRWIQFDNNIFGDNIKYYDHFECIGRSNELFIDARFYKKIPIETLLNQIQPYEISVDLDKLWDASIFHNGEISKYIRYEMTD